jgi:phage replication-related protein YjqB (UPF0714/DUF867 family)/GNAT superfamily N-acetyltransferase
MSPADAASADAAIREAPCTTAALAEHARVPIAFLVERMLDPALVRPGPLDFGMLERPVAVPWPKDYDAVAGERPVDWAARWDVSTWGVIAMQAGGERVGGAVVAWNTGGVDMLEDRRDLAVLWDIRLAPFARGRGLGSRLWQAAERWARARGCSQLKVETQNINVAACRLYQRSGAVLRGVNRGAYAGFPDEVQLIWYRKLDGVAIVDTYADFEALAAAEVEGRDYVVRIRAVGGAPFVIAAPHGGGIEPGTSEVADAIAGREYSFCAFEGIGSADNRRLHVTSTRFDEPRCLALAGAGGRVVTIHGMAMEAPVVELGGLDHGLIGRLGRALVRRGFDARLAEARGIRGLDPGNLCNRGAGGAGVQLELSLGLRRSFFLALGAAGRRTRTRRFAAFVGAVREGLSEGLPC